MKQQWIRSDLKQRAKTAFRKNYWAAVIVSLILAIVTGAGSGGSGGRSSATADYSYDTETAEFAGDAFGTVKETVSSIHFSPVSMAVAMLSIGLILALACIVILLKVFAGNLLEVGGKGFYVENLYSNPRVGRVLAPFNSGHYWNVVKVMFCRDLFVALWSLLFVIPGIVKSYEYRMVPYLLAEYPDMPREEAFAASKEMMYGEKWNAFVLDVSFIGWKLLSGITFGLVGLFYANPYIDAANAELYDVLAAGASGNQNM